MVCLKDEDKQKTLKAKPVTLYDQESADALSFLLLLFQKSAQLAATFPAVSSLTVDWKRPGAKAAQEKGRPCKSTEQGRQTALICCITQQSSTLPLGAATAHKLASKLLMNYCSQTPKRRVSLTSACDRTGISWRGVKHTERGLWRAASCMSTDFWPYSLTPRLEAVSH